MAELAWRGLSESAAAALRRMKRKSTMQVGRPASQHVLAFLGTAEPRLQLAVERFPDNGSDLARCGELQQQ
jgi:hypothetical protein